MLFFPHREMKPSDVVFFFYKYVFSNSMFHSLLWLLGNRPLHSLLFSVCHDGHNGKVVKKSSQKFLNGVAELKNGWIHISNTTLLWFCWTRQNNSFLDALWIFAIMYYFLLYIWPVNESKEQRMAAKCISLNQWLFRSNWAFCQCIQYIAYTGAAQ